MCGVYRDSCAWPGACLVLEHCDLLAASRAACGWKQQGDQNADNGDDDNNSTNVNPRHACLLMTQLLVLK